MSKVIDERVVEMRFDNKDFESNVQTSLKTIDKLKDSLNFDESTRSIEKFNDSLRHFSLDDIGRSVEGLSDKFNWSNIFKVELLSNVVETIYSKITSAFEKIKGALHLENVDPIGNMLLGWDKFAEKSQSVATIMAATGESIELVSEQMEDLMYFTDETSYSFTDMAGNIGKFTANGVGLEEASASMQGIATWAARSGQNAATASRVMYNLSQAIGMGALKLQDWKSVELANMGTKEFKEMAIQAGLATGALIENAEGIAVINDETVGTIKETAVTFENFRETLKDGWFDTETINTVLGEYGKAAILINEIHNETGLYAKEMMELVDAQKEGVDITKDLEEALKEANPKATTKDFERLRQQIELLASKEYEFSVETYKAAQEARTFGDAMNSVADAVSTGWTKTFELIFGSYDKAKIIWSDLAENLYEIFRASIDARNRLLSEANTSGFDTLKNSLAEAGVSMLDLEHSVKRIVGTKDLRLMIGDTVSFEDAVKEGAISVDILEKAIMNLPGSFKRVKEVAGEVTDNFEEMTAWSWELRKGMYGWDEGHDYQVQKLMEAKKISKEYAEQVVELSERHEELGRELTKEEAAQWLTYTELSKQVEENIELTDEQREAWIKMLDEIDQASFQDSLRNGLLNVGAIALELFTQVREAIVGMFPPKTASQLRVLGANFERITGSILEFLENSTVIKDVVSALVFPFKIIYDIAAGLLKLITPLGRLLLTLFSPVVWGVEAFAKLLNKINEATGTFNPFARIINRVVEAITVLLNHINDIAKYVGDIVKNKLIEKLSTPFQKLIEVFNKFKNNTFTGLDNFINTIKNADVKESGDKIVTFLKNLYRESGLVGKALSALVYPFKTFASYLKIISSSDNDLSLFQKVLLALRFTVVKVFNDISAELKKFGVNIEPIRTSITNFVKDISTRFENLKNKITAVFYDFRRRFQGLGIASKDLNIFQRAFLALQGTLTDLAPFDKIAQKFRELRQTIREFFLGTGEENNTGFLGSISEKLDNARTTVTNFFSNFKLQTEDGQSVLQTFIDSLGITLPKVLTGAGVALAGGGIIKFIKTLKETKEKKGGNLLEDMVKSILPFSDSVEKLGTAVSSFNIVNFAIGMGLLAGALIAMSFVPTDKLVTSLGTLGASLAAFIGTIASVNKVMGDKGTFKLVGMGLGMIMIAGSLLMFARAIDRFSELDIGSNGKILKVLGGLLLAVTTMGRLAKVAGKNNFKFTAGLGLVATAGSLFLFAKALEKFANMKIDKKQIDKVIGGLLSAIVTFSVIAGVVGKTRFKLSNGLGLIALATSLYMFAGLIAIFGHMDKGVLRQGGECVFVLGLVLAAIAKLMTVATKDLKLTQALGVFVMLAGVVGSIAILAAAIYALGKMPQDVIEAGGHNMFAIGTFILLMAAALGHVGKGAGLRGAASAFIMLTGIVLAIISLAGVILILGTMSKKVDKGLKALGWILAALGVAFYGMNKLIAPNIKNALKSVAAIALFGIALIPMVYVLTKLGDLDFATVQKNLLLLGELLLAFVAIIGVATVVGALAGPAAPIILAGIGVITGAFAIFVAGLTILVKDIERLAAVDSENAKKGLECVKEELGILVDLAHQFMNEEGLFKASLQAAKVCKKFGKGLHELAEDTFILGISNAAQARESLKVVQEEIELMMALGTMLVQNEGAFSQAILASAVAFNFGIGLHGLANDTRILGLVNAENAKAAIEPLSGLIAMMIGLAETIGTDVTLFGKAILVTADMVLFGLALLPLVGAEFLTGLANAENVTSNMTQISNLIDKLFNLATKISEDASLYFTAKAAAEAIKDFGYALLPLVASEFLSQFIDAEASTAGFKATQEIVDWLIGIAGQFQGENSINLGAAAAVDRLSGFAKSLAKLTITDFFSQFVDAERALEGLTPVQTIVDMLVGMVQELTSNGGSVDAAKTAVESVKTFAESLNDIIWIMSSHALDSVDSTAITSVIDAIVLGLSKLTSIDGDIASVGPALQGVGDIFSSLDSLATSGGLFGKKSIDTTSITDAFTAIGDSIVTLGTTIETENIGSKIIDTIMTPLTTESGNALNTLLNIGQEMSNTIASFEQLFYVDGNNIAVGFINGINSRRQDAYDAGFGLAEDAERGTRDAGKIESPSKVFSELGGYIGEGFINGIESKYGQISTAAEGMAQRAIDIVNDLRERMQRVLADKANELRITPVVDMADVSKLSEIMGNIQGSRNYATSYVHNAEVDSAISSKSYTPELRSLMDYVSQLGEHIDNMQMVLDTGVLVGATSAKMDSQFGIMTMRRGRGN